MRYDVPSANLAPGPSAVRIPPNHDITYIAWRVEGANAPMAATWRSLASVNGIIDPMQIADEIGRVILGRTLTAGATLRLD